MPHIGKNPAPIASTEYWFSEIPAHGYYGQTSSQMLGSSRTVLDTTHEALYFLVQNQGVVIPVCCFDGHIPRNINGGNSHHVECLSLCPPALNSMYCNCLKFLEYSHNVSHFFIYRKGIGGPQPLSKQLMFTSQQELGFQPKRPTAGIRGEKDELKQKIVFLSLKGRAVI